MHIRHPSIQRFTAKGCPVAVYPDKLQMGEAAATLARRLIRAGIAERGLCRIVVDDATSQTHVIAALTGMDGIEWSRVEVFQSNEYVGLAESHPASFRRWVKTRIADRVRPKATHYLHGDAPDPAAECDRYGRLLAAAPIDLCFVGFGDNAHIAFNDPHSADFNDPKAVKRVRLDERCRMQQVGEERFPSLRATPLEAVTLTCPTLLRTGHIISCVPDFRKANAVKDAIEGPRSTRCPASLVLTHPDAHLFLDTRSAALLEHRGDVS